MEKLEIATAEAELRKLSLEIQLLARQNSWKGQWIQVTTVITVLATVISAWIGFVKFRSDNQKERELKQREIEQRIDNQYRSDVKELLSFPYDDKKSIPVVISLFQDLRRLVESKPQGGNEQENSLGADIGPLISSLIHSSDFTFDKLRHLEFDLAALQQSDHYSAYLTQDTSRNLDILSKCHEELQRIHQEDKNLVESIIVGPDENFIVPHKGTNAPLLIKLFYCYKSHYDLLKKAQEAKSEDQGIKEALHLAFCWVYGATRNISFTSRACDLGTDAVQAEWAKCK